MELRLDLFVLLYTREIDDFRRGVVVIRARRCALAVVVELHASGPPGRGPMRHARYIIAQPPFI